MKICLSDWLFVGSQFKMQMCSKTISGISGKSENCTFSNFLSFFDLYLFKMSVKRYQSIPMLNHHIITIAHSFLVKYPIRSVHIIHYLDNCSVSMSRNPVALIIIFYNIYTSRPTLTCVALINVFLVCASYLCISCF